MNQKLREQQALRTRLTAQLRERDSKLSNLEAKLGKRLGAARAALQAARKKNDSLAQSLQRFKQAAMASAKRNEKIQKLLSQRDKQLKAARDDAAESERLANNAVARAARVAKLLSARERQLGQMEQALRRRDSVLAAELKRAREQETKARRAGRKQDMAAAVKLRARLARERGQLKRKLVAQRQALSSARSEAKTNAEARARAEREASVLRAELAKQTKAISALKKAKDAKAQRILAKKLRDFESLRNRLNKRMRDRESQLTNMGLHSRRPRSPSSPKSPNATMKRLRPSCRPRAPGPRPSVNELNKPPLGQRR